MLFRSELVPEGVVELPWLVPGVASLVVAVLLGAFWFILVLSVLLLVALFVLVSSPVPPWFWLQPAKAKAASRITIDFFIVESFIY